MTFSPGTRLGPYELTAPIGAGGWKVTGRRTPPRSHRGGEGATEHLVVGSAAAVRAGGSGRSPTGARTYICSSRTPSHSNRPSTTTGDRRWAHRCRPRSAHFSVAGATRPTGEHRGEAGPFALRDRHIQSRGRAGDGSRPVRRGSISSASSWRENRHRSPVGAGRGRVDAVIRSPPGRSTTSSTRCVAVIALPSAVAAVGA